MINLAAIANCPAELVSPFLPEHRLPELNNSAVEKDNPQDI